MPLISGAVHVPFSGSRPVAAHVATNAYLAPALKCGAVVTVPFMVEDSLGAKECALVANEVASAHEVVIVTAAGLPSDGQLLRVASPPWSSQRLGLQR